MLTLLTTSQVKIILSIHVVLADILLTKINQGLGDTLPSNVTAFEKPESNQEQPQLITAARNKNKETKINPNLNASLPTFYSIPHMPQRAQAISTFSFAAAVLIKTHCSFPVTFLHIFERMLSATTKYLA